MVKLLGTGSGLPGFTYMAPKSIPVEAINKVAETLLADGYDPLNMPPLKEVFLDPQTPASDIYTTYTSQVIDRMLELQG